MEEQIEEGDVLGTEAWNGEYDIAEEEEERLLEEQEDSADQGGEQAYFDGEYEASEVEEDVLDLFKLCIWRRGTNPCWIRIQTDKMAIID